MTDAVFDVILYMSQGKRYGGRRSRNRSPVIKYRQVEQSSSTRMKSGREPTSDEQVVFLLDEVE